MVCGHKQARLIPDDFREAAPSLVPVEPSGRPTSKLKSLRSVDEASFEGQRLRLPDSRDASVERLAAQIPSEIGSRGYWVLAGTKKPDPKARLISLNH